MTYLNTARKRIFAVNIGGNQTSWKVLERKKGQHLLEVGCMSDTTVHTSMTETQGRWPHPVVPQWAQPQHLSSLTAAVTWNLV